MNRLTDKRTEKVVDEADNERHERKDSLLAKVRPIHLVKQRQDSGTDLLSTGRSTLNRVRHNVRPVDTRKRVADALADRRSERVNKRSHARSRVVRVKQITLNHLRR